MSDEREPLVTGTEVAHVIASHRCTVFGMCSCGTRFSSRMSDDRSALQHVGDAIAELVAERSRQRAQARGNQVAARAAGPDRVPAGELGLTHYGRTATIHRADHDPVVGVLLGSDAHQIPDRVLLEIADGQGVDAVFVDPLLWIELA